MKDIKQLVPDLQKAIAQGSKYAAEEMSFQLRDQGPYWTGTFYESIRISNGANGPARTVSPPVANESGGFEREERPSTEKVKVNNPDKINLKLINQTMYTIGSAVNSQDYVNISCDLEPKSKPYPARTAEKNWFTSYFGGESSLRDRDIEPEFKKGMRQGGF